MKEIYRKILFAVIWYIIYYPICYLIFIPSVFSIPLYLFSLIIYYFIGIIDVIIRPMKERGEKFDKYDIIMVLLFILHPFLVILAFYENLLLIAQFIPLWNNLIISYIGLPLFIVGGIIGLLARKQLGKFATGELMVQKEHHLITSGLYGIIRHPIYFAGLLGTFGFLLVFRCIIILVVNIFLLILVFRQRINQEEKILLEAFGEEYRDYMKRTKRLIPYIY